VLTKLDRYLIMQFDPLINTKMEKITSGNTFIHRTSHPRLFTSTIYPFRFTEDSNILIKLDETIPPSQVLKIFIITMKFAIICQNGGIIISF